MDKITVKNIDINITGTGDADFISLTDIARAKNSKKNINEYIKENILNTIYGNDCELDLFNSW